jgi:hypothetical protein
MSANGVQHPMMDLRRIPSAVDAEKAFGLCHGEASEGFADGAVVALPPRANRVSHTAVALREAALGL